MSDGRMVWYEREIDQLFAFADLLCTGLGEPMFIAASARDTIDGLTVMRGGWVGDLSQWAAMSTSKAPYVAPWKLAEVMQIALPDEGELVMTPDPTWPASTGWMGAVRMICGRMDLGIAASKWRQEHDRLLSLVLLYDCLLGPLQLHHTGFRFPTEAEYVAANAEWENGMVRDAPDHRRTYFNVGPAYREHQYWPEASTGTDGFPHRHWDLVSSRPLETLQFLASGFDREPATWEAAPNNPIGAVLIPSATDRSKLGVMTRPTWWNVEYD